MAIVRCATAAEVTREVDRLQATRGSALLVFFGSEDPASGHSWCPDCVTADPVLRRSCHDLRPELTLFECPVGARSEWKDRPEHPYRTHPVLRLARIPTLLRIDAGCERGRLVEADCARADLVRAFLAA